jgi:hypothetical protein
MGRGGTVVVNLISRETARRPFPRFDPQQRARFEARLASVVAVHAKPACHRPLDRLLLALEGDLEELESEPSLVTALDLLDSVERARGVALGREPEAAGAERFARADHRGDLIVHWPGRSLATGEAGIASRGLFDERDRPPLQTWVEAIGRRTTPTAEDFEVAILAWIPREDLERARAGCRACVGGTLAFLETVSPGLSDQLEPILGRAATP